MDLFKEKMETWEGQWIRLKREIRNGDYIFPKGILMKITTASTKTIHLQTLGCPCCRLIARVSLQERKKDYPLYFEFVEESEVVRELRGVARNENTRL